MEAAASDASSPRDVRKDSPPFARPARRGRGPAGSRGASLGIAARPWQAGDRGAGNPVRVEYARPASPRAMILQWTPTTAPGWREMLDLQEGRGPVPVLDETAIATLLRGRPRVAVVGASDRPGRPSREVFLALRAGRPRRGAGDAALRRRSAGVPAYPDLAAAVAATGPFDIVDVFRRPERLPGARPRGRGGRRPGPLAPARDRQLGGGPDRPRRRPRRRDGPLPVGGALASRARAQAAAARVAGSAERDDEPHDDEDGARPSRPQPRSAPGGAARPSRPRRRSSPRAAARRSAAPGAVALGVLVLGLQRLVAAPGLAAPATYPPRRGRRPWRRGAKPTMFTCRPPRRGGRGPRPGRAPHSPGRATPSSPARRGTRRPGPCRPGSRRPRPGSPPAPRRRGGRRPRRRRSGRTPARRRCPRPVGRSRRARRGPPWRSAG